MALRILLIIGLGALALSGAYKIAQRAAKERQESRALLEFRRDIGERMERELDRDGTVSPDTSMQALDDIRSRVNKMAQQDGDAGKEMKVVGEVLAEMQQRAAPYMELVKELETMNPLDIGTVKSKADLAARRDLGTRMLQMNKELMKFMDSVDEMMWEKMKSSGVASGTKTQFMTGFAKGIGQGLKLQRQIRMTDETIAKSMIAMMDLLDTGWGKWKWTNDGVEFEDDAAATQFTALAEEVRKAGEEQAAAQREIARKNQGR